MVSSSFGFFLFFAFYRTRSQHFTYLTFSSSPLNAKALVSDRYKTYIRDGGQGYELTDLNIAINLVRILLNNLFATSRKVSETTLPPPSTYNIHATRKLNSVCNYEKLICCYFFVGGGVVVVFFCCGFIFLFFGCCFLANIETWFVMRYI